MAITFDPAKRDRAVAERGLHFVAVAKVFSGPPYDREDTRRDYGERRILTAGYLAGRMMIVGWTLRGEDRHVFSMRKANA